MGDPTSCVKFLFFDNRTLEYTDGMTRRYGRAEKYAGNPLLVPELPNEFRRAHYYGTALYDEEEGVYKTWYASHFYGAQFGEADNRAYSYLNYAVSKDGIHFEKPSLDVVPGTNIVLDDPVKQHGPTVIIDREDPDPERRYKLAMSPYTLDCQVIIWVSPDGIHWRPLTGSPAIAGIKSDCHTGFYRDPLTGLYHLTFRTRCPDRRVWGAQSEDLLHWSRIRMLTEPDQSDPCGTQFYGMQVTPYGAYRLGQISMYNTFDFKSDPNPNKMAGTMDIQLAYSRDGHCWHRSDQRTPIVPFGEKGEWDSGCVTPSSTLMYRPDGIRFYYSGWALDHSGVLKLRYEDTPKECIGLATLRPDGFVALEAGETEGELMTRPFAVADSRLYLNAAAEDGEVRASLCDVEGRPIAGYSYEDCLPFTGDCTASQVQWKGAPSSGAAEGKVIRLRVRAKNARLYSCFFPHGEPPENYWRFKEISCLNPLMYDLPAEK